MPPLRLACARSRGTSRGALKAQRCSNRMLLRVLEHRQPLFALGGEFAPILLGNRSLNQQGLEELLAGRKVGWWYGCLGGSDEIILLAQPPIDASGNLSGGRALDGASIATQQHCQRNFGMGLIRIGHKPADAR